MPSERASSGVLCGDEAALYDRHQEVLWRRVRRHIHGPYALIDDACQQGWLILLRAPARARDRAGVADDGRDLQALAALPERQRCYLTLRVAGHSYVEIGEVRRLDRARSRSAEPGRKTLRLTLTCGPEAALWGWT